MLILPLKNKFDTTFMDIVLNKGVIPFTRGGLGNQLFILASGYSIARELSCPLYILKKSPEDNKHNIHKQDYMFIFQYLGKVTDIIQSDVLLYQLQSIDYKIHDKGISKCFEPWTVENESPGLLLNNYYQYYPPIEKYESEIRERILYGLSSIPSVSIEGDTCAFIHIRRGDYVELQSIHFLQSIDYYKRALDILYEKNKNIKKLYIFSDDIKWVKQQDFFKNISNGVFYENTNELETFNSMVQCRGGAICANSSFSWWAAFLGSHGSRNPVIVPKKWFIQEPVDLFPKEWIIAS